MISYPRSALLALMALLASRLLAQVIDTNAVSATADASLSWGKGVKVLVVGGGTSHDFKKWFGGADVATLRADGRFSVNYTENPAAATKALADADVLVSSTNQKDFDTPEFRAALMKFAAAGKGLVLLHPAVWYNWPWPEYNALLVGGGSRGHDAIAPFTVNVLREHPVTRDLPKTFTVTDELYHLKLDPAGTPVEVLAQTSASSVTHQEHPSVWLVKHPQARIVGIAIGHDGRVHELPAYKKLLVNAAAWTSGAN